MFVGCHKVEDLSFLKRSLKNYLRQKCITDDDDI